MPACLIGVSGWRYKRWRGDLYPRGLLQKDELGFVASRTTSLELNGSFYSLQRPSSYVQWEAATPPEFVFAIKGGRYITHLKQLRDVEQPLANFFASGVLVLGHKLGPVLWQLPPRMSFAPGKLVPFLELLPGTHAEALALAGRHDGKLSGDRTHLELGEGVDPGRRLRHALDPRHESFLSEAAHSLLAEHGVAMVVADSADEWPTMPDAVTDFRYVRLHGEAELYTSAYSDDSLDRWAETCVTWLGAGHDVHVYFDNDAAGHAPHDAVRLLARIRQAGFGE